MLFTVGPKCDYEDCPQHAVQVERSLSRHHYCTTECRDAQRKLRHNRARVNVEARSAVISKMVAEHKAKRTPA